MAGEPPPETLGQWVSVAEAARRLGVTSRAIRSRMAHRTITFRPKGNAGREVFLPDAPASPGGSAEDAAVLPGASAEAGDHPHPEPLPEGVELREELAEERVVRARLEERLAAGEQREIELRTAFARERAVLEDRIADMGSSLVAERKRADRLEAVLAEARRPWLAKVLEGLRRKGS